MGPSLRKFCCLALLAGGVLFWLFTFRDSGYRFKALAWAGGLGLVWPVTKWIFRQAEACGKFLSRHRMSAAAATALLAAGVSLFHVLSRPGGFVLRIHDDHVYMIEAQMLARGRLWMPALPSQLQPFFDSFHLLMEPVYAGMYAPGVAMMLTPGVWLHAPYWAMPIVASSLAAALLFLVLQELFDSVRAALGVLMMVCGFSFTDLATVALSEMPALLAQLTLWWAWLQWRKRHGHGWAFLMGAAIGYCAITRPLDALCLCTLITVVIFVEHRKNGRLILKTFAVMAIATLPFVIMQIIQNIGLAGAWYSYAESSYLRHVYPAPAIGFFALDFSRMPAHPGPEKAMWLKKFVLTSFDAHTFSNVLHWWYPHQFQKVFKVTMPHSALLALMPVGLLSLKETRRAAFVACIPLFLVAYICCVFYLDHYFFPLIPSLTCLIFMGWESLERAWPARRAAIGGFMLVWMIGLAVADLPIFNPDSSTTNVNGYDVEQRTADQALAHLPKTPAVVLFRFDPAVCNPNEEPVYNDTAAWPDDATIVRVRDLGPDQNWKLIQHYAKTQPNRWFYIYDRGAIFRSHEPLSPPLGTAESLAAQFRKN